MHGGMRGTYEYHLSGFHFEKRVRTRFGSREIFQAPSNVGKTNAAKKRLTGAPSQYGGPSQYARPPDAYAGLFSVFRTYLRGGYRTRTYM